MFTLLIIAVSPVIVSRFSVKFPGKIQKGLNEHVSLTILFQVIAGIKNSLLNLTNFEST